MDTHEEGVLGVLVIQVPGTWLAGSEFPWNQTETATTRPLKGKPWLDVIFQHHFLAHLFLF